MHCGVLWFKLEGTRLIRPVKYTGADVMHMLRHKSASALNVHLFPSSYAEARERFLEAAHHAHCDVESWPLQAPGPRQTELNIDVARWGNPHAANWLIVSSGLHGTEGPFGSAVQLELLNHLASKKPDPHQGILFLHALNPFGYAWVRRANEDNIDLNRNFLLPGEKYQGAHPLFRYVYQTFNPHRPRRIYHNFYLEAWWLISRYSKAALQASLPVGQYEFPEGLFFGGKAPSQTLTHLQWKTAVIVPSARNIVHLDFHTGLGKWASGRLLIDSQVGDDDYKWWNAWAPREMVEPVTSQSTAYLARGTIGPWMKQIIFPQANYRYAAAEFGTYGGVRVLRSLVEELRSHYALDPDDRRYQAAKKLVQETFIPPSFAWRSSVLHQGVALCENAYRALPVNDLQRLQQGVSSVPAQAY